MKIRVRIVHGPAKNDTFIIEKNTKWIIGRDDNASFQIRNDELISREHFSIAFDGQTVTLIDLGSTNGTFVDKRQLEKHQPVVLNDCQKFVAGRTTIFMVLFEDESESARQPPVGTPNDLPVAKDASSIVSRPNFDSDLAAGDSNPANQRSISESSGNFSRSITTDIGDPERSVSGQNEDSGSFFFNHPDKPGASPSEFRQLPDSADSSKKDMDSDSLEQFGNHGASIADPGQLGSGESRKFAPLPGDVAPTDESSQDSSPSVGKSSRSPTPPVPGSIFAPVPGVEKQQIPELDNRQTSSPSIAMPDQVVVVQPRADRSPDQSRNIDSPSTGKYVYELTECDNGVKVYLGKEPADVPHLLAMLRERFDSVFCVDMLRAETETEADVDDRPDSNSNFEDGSLPPSQGMDPNTLGESPFESLEEPDDPPEETKQPGKTPTNIRIGTPLFDWLPADVRWDQPLLLSDEEFSMPLDGVWQKDGLVCLFGASSKQIKNHCLELVRTNLRTGKKSDVIFGFCWPSVLEGVLTSQSAKSVDRIYEGGIAAILMEDPQQEFAWKLASKNDLEDLLAEGGFVQQSCLAEPDTKIDPGGQ